ncbi:MAG: hypothetical protein ABI197_00885 [Granulicella sp.]
MKLLAASLALALSPLLTSAQTAPAAKRPAATHTASAKAASPTPKTLLPFSGTWFLNQKRSSIEGTRPQGKSKAVIQYDGKTWHYIHTQMNGYDQLDDTWQITMAVNSPTYHTEREEPLTFRSRIRTVGNSLVMDEYVRTDKGQHTRNTVTYTLQDDGNTLIELEKEKGPIGTETNRWVLERQGTGATASNNDQP